MDIGDRTSMTFSPVVFETSKSPDVTMHLFNNDVLQTAYTASKFVWILYGFGSELLFYASETSLL